MRLLLAATVAALLATPALADQFCWYVSPANDWMTFLPNGENQVIVQWHDARRTETCEYGQSGSGKSMLWCDETKIKGSWSRSGDRLVFDHLVWDRQCR